MSFISEQEAHERLRDPRNILSRADRSTSDEQVKITIPEPVLPELVEEVGTPSVDESDGAKQTHASAGNVDAIDALLSETIDASFDPTTFKKSTEFDPFTALKLARDIDKHTPGRKAGIRNRTLEENGSLGLSTLLLGPTATEDMFGVNQTQQNHIQHGYVSSTDRVAKKNKKEELLDEIHGQGRKVVDRAFSKILKSLDLLTDDKLNQVTKATDLVNISKGLSGVIKDMTPKEATADEGGIHFHIFAPERNTAEHYETVEVGADGSVTVER